ncbi:MAG: hypothetical protein ACR2PK_05855 [Acidimicrobiales bacterium]
MDTSQVANKTAQEDEPERVSDGPLTPEKITAELDRRGHIVTSWDEIGAIELPTEAVATMYKIGQPDNEESPTVFKMWFPPGCTIEAHTHACDYSEIVLEGSQMVGRTWLHPGDIRVGLANRGYGPLVAGPEGASVLVIFANGKWPGIPLGKNDGGTLATPEITERFE